jgi:hypothetical protein
LRCEGILELGRWQTEPKGDLRESITRAIVERLVFIKKNPQVISNLETTMLSIVDIFRKLPEKKRGVFIEVLFKEASDINPEEFYSVICKMIMIAIKEDEDLATKLLYFAENLAREPIYPNPNDLKELRK